MYHECLDGIVVQGGIDIIRWAGEVEGRERRRRREATSRTVAVDIDAGRNGRGHKEAGRDAVGVGDDAENEGVCMRRARTRARCGANEDAARRERRVEATSMCDPVLAPYHALDFKRYL